MSFKNIMLFAGIIACGVISTAQAGSDAKFPKGWESWPVKSSGAIPSNKTAIAGNLPPIVQETFKTYNWTNDGKGTAYKVRVNPAQEGGYKARNGKFNDGPTAVLDLTDIKAILVTEHFLGEPVYGAFSYDGKDLSGAHGSLSPAACKKCHTGYGNACVTGVCSHK